MDWFLKRRLVLLGIIAFSLVAILIFVIGNDCDEKSVEVKKFVEKINQSSEGKYHLYLDQCYLEAHIINRTDNVDSALFHNFLVRLMQIESRNYFVNVYSKDSMLLYVEYAGYNNGDTTYHKVDHYEY